MNKKANDISLCEKIFSHFRYWQDFTVMLFYLKKTFKNSGYVLSRAFKNDFPINEAVAPNEIKTAENPSENKINFLYFIDIMVLNFLTNII